MRVVLVKGLFWFPGLIRSTYLFFSLLVLASCVRSNFINFSYSFEAAKCSRGTQLFFCELVGGPARVSYKLVGTDSVIHLPSAFPQGSHTNCITVCSFDRKGISAIVFCHLFDSKRWISVIWTGMILPWSFPYFSKPKTVPPSLFFLPGETLIWRRRVCSPSRSGILASLRVFRTKHRLTKNLIELYVKK